MKNNKLQWVRKYDGWHAEYEGHKMRLRNWGGWKAWIVHSDGTEREEKFCLFHEAKSHLSRIYVEKDPLFYNNEFLGCTFCER